MLFDELKGCKCRVEDIDKQLKQRVTEDEDCQRPIGIPGYGPIISTALIAAKGNGAQYSNGRGLSTNLGLTPRHGRQNPAHGYNKVR